MALSARTKKKARAALSICRRIATRVAISLTLLFIVFSCIANWFVRHSNEWLNDKRLSWPGFIVESLFYIGEPFADITDSFGMTGEDAVCEMQHPYKGGQTFFAGAPVRKNDKAPDDIIIVDKGEFTVAYSPRLRHPVWCAYRIGKESKFNIHKRPGFRKDKAFKSCPAASAYAKTGYDRGHMVPNYAIMSRHGREAQKKTFLMSNISPQTPNLNRGIWREIEHRIADLFTDKWNEAWVIIGAISEGYETLSGTDIDVPTAYYQLIATSSDNEIRTLALLFEQEVPWKAWPRHYIVSVDELEERTGFDFFHELDDSIEEKLESQTPTRLLPVGFFNAFKALKIHLNEY